MLDGIGNDRIGGKMIRTLFRLVFFVFGTVSGFVIALLVLPIPGKTLFNKMSKLPNNVKKLIDDTIDFSSAFFNLINAIGRTFYQEYLQLAKKIQTRIDAVNEKYSTEFDEDDNFKSKKQRFIGKKVEVSNGYQS